MLFKISGHVMRPPTSFTIERYNVTKSNRLANGDMSMELIAKKKKYLCEYETLDQDEYARLMSCIDGGNVFFQVTAMDNGEIKTRTMYAGAISAVRFRSPRHGVWYWKNVKFNLIER